MKTKKAKKAKKCGLCREYGHDIRTCKLRAPDRLKAHEIIVSLPIRKSVVTV